MRKRFAGIVLGAFLVGLGLGPVMMGQAKPDAVFTPAAKKALGRLEVIAKGIPDGGWKYHDGGLPHGEDFSVSDASWTEAGKAGYELPVTSVWFRRTLVLPKSLEGYSLDGSKLYFKFNAKAEGGMPQIIYVDGSRVALGEDLEPVLLTTDAKPGQTFHIAVKLLHTAGVKRIMAATYSLMMPESRPNPADFRVEEVSAAILLPTITTDAAKLSEQIALLNRAAEMLDLKALDAGEQGKFDASLRAAETVIAPLKPVLQTLKMPLIGNSHMDTAWLWPWTETVDTARRTFSTALQLMTEYPGYKYAQSYALYYEWMQEKYPDIFQQILERVKEGRWEVLGGMWVEPDLNMPDGESQVRQLLVGKRLLEKTTGVDTNVGWNPDSFGYNWQLPQIYKKSGVDYFVTQKMKWNETNVMPLKTFWWQSPDGSRVLTFFPSDYNKDPIPLNLAGDMAVVRKDNPGQDTMLHLYGIGDHGGGPTRAVLELAQHWMEPDKVYPKMENSTTKAFFESIAPRVVVPAGTPEWNYKLWAAKGELTLPPAVGTAINVPVWNDELYLEFHRGVYTTQARHKQNMREEEERMLDAEKVAAITWLGRRAYPATELNEAWKKVLMDQFHDTMSGSGVASVYVDTQRDFEAVRLATDEITKGSLTSIAAHVDTQTKADAVPVLVFNPLGWKRNGDVVFEVQLPKVAKVGVAVTTPDGKPVLTQSIGGDATTGRYRLLMHVEDVPSLGYLVLQARDGKADAKTDLKATDTTLENRLVKVEIDPSTGCMVHLVDKASGFDSIAPGGCGNELQTFVDTPQKYDAWNIDADALTKMTPIHEVDSVKLVEQGPLRASIRIERHWGKSKFVQTVQLEADSAQVDVANDFDWQETHVLLKAAFPLAASSGYATYEIPYGTIERPTARNNNVEKAKFEVPALRWADLGDGQHGLSLMNQTKYGYDAAGNVLRLSLLRSAMYPMVDADKGEQKFLYSVYPHAGTWQQAMTVRHGYELNYGLSAMQVSGHAGALPAEHSFVGIDSDAVVLTAMKKAEDSDGLILRMYEWQGKTSPVRITVPGAPKSAEEVGMMENDVRGAEKLEGNTVITTAKPFEIKTIRVDYPADASIWMH